MSGTVREAKLTTPTARARLKRGRQPAWRTIVPGRIHLLAGWIDAFSGSTHNAFVGALRNATGTPLSIPGLWEIVFGTFLNSDADTLYFTAGPNNQTNGLFGKIVARPDDDFAAK
jgi:hypothetical protein